MSKLLLTAASNVGQFHCGIHNRYYKTLMNWNKHLMSADHKLIGSSVTCSHCGSTIKIENLEITAQKKRRVQCKLCNQYTYLDMPAQEIQDMKDYTKSKSIVMAGAKRVKVRIMPDGRIVELHPATRIGVNTRSVKVKQQGQLSKTKPVKKKKVSKKK